MPKKIITIDELALLTQEEFLAVRESQQQMQKTLRVAVDTLDLVRADIHDVKLTLGPLVSHVARTEEKVQELEKRVERVERKVGLAT